MAESEQLLRDYANGSEDAFRALVTRHLNLVYGTARRLTGGDAHLAEDVAQVVFRDLAQKAANLPRGTVVAGWLYRHTCFTSAKIVRGDRRRAAREELSMTIASSGTENQIVDHLEPALAKLGESDRLAIILRYLEERDWVEVSQALGVSVEAAQKRASRALEKLRAVLEKDGLQVSGASLGVLLSAQSVSAPAGLALRISTNSLTNLTASTPMMTSMAAKITVLAGLGVAVAIPIVMQRQQLTEAERDRGELRRQVAALQAQLHSAGNGEQELSELERLRKDAAEVHKLRAELTALRRQLQEKRRVVTENSPPQPSEPVLPNQVTIEARMAVVPPELFPEIQALGIALPAENGSVPLTRLQASTLQTFFERREGVEVLAAPKVTTLSGRQARVSIEDLKALPDGTRVPLGHVVDILPSLGPDAKTIALTVETTFTEFLGYSSGDDGQALPRFRVRQSQAEAMLSHDRTLLLQAREHSGSDQVDRRKLLILIDPQVILPDGNVYRPE